MHVEEISQTSRNTQGVRLIRVGDEEYVSTVARVNVDDGDEEELEEQMTDDTEIVTSSETEDTTLENDDESSDEGTEEQ
jgi:DNA gyrase subunit A